MFSLICAWTNGWPNNRDADDLRYHCTYYDVTVMFIGFLERCHWVHDGARYHGDVIMDAIASQITSLTIVYSSVYSDADQRKHQISASLAFVRGIHRRPVNSPHKWPVTRKMFPFDHVIMTWPETSVFCCYLVYEIYFIFLTKVSFFHFAVLIKCSNKRFKT